MQEHSAQQMVGQSLTLMRANLKTRYRNTISGLVWVILNPVLMFGAQAIVFHYILKVNVERYPLFLLSGILPWIFIVQSIEMGTGSFTNQGRLLKSFPIHPFVVLVAQILDNLFSFLLSFTAIFLPTAIYYGFDAIRFLLLPLAILPLFIFINGLTFLLATIQVFFWDTRFVISFVINVAFYLTPIIYPLEMIPAEYRWLMKLNPLWYVLRPFQLAIVGDIHLFSRALTESTIVALLIFGLAILNWRRSKNELYFYI